MKNNISKRRLILGIILCCLVLFSTYISIFVFHCCGHFQGRTNVSQLETRAAGGDVVAMRELSFFFDSEQDFATGRYWLQRGAEAGDPVAEYHLGAEVLRKPDPANVALGMHYIMSSAKHGHPMAQFALGEYYRDGKFIERNRDLAVLWLKKAVESGTPDAALSLVEILLSDAELRDDYEECFFWNAKGLALVPPLPRGASRIDLENQRSKIIVEAGKRGFRHFE